MAVKMPKKNGKNSVKQMIRLSLFWAILNDSCKRADKFIFNGIFSTAAKIGRASCRERV